MTADGLYRNRHDAGRALAAYLKERETDIGPDPLVLGLPRGGMPVAYEVALALGAPLDVFLVRKVGFPAHPELAMGAIASGGVRVLDERSIAEARIRAEDVVVIIEQETRELARREHSYLAERRPVAIASHPVVVVDDGLATGFTLRAAVAALRIIGCPRITVAVPVGAQAPCEELAREVDLLVCLVQPQPFRAVGLWYEDFSEVTDYEVKTYLERATRNLPPVPFLTTTETGADLKPGPDSPT
jgi:predicted phosphoribosyltransferase